MGPTKKDLIYCTVIIPGGAKKCANKSGFLYFLDRRRAISKVSAVQCFARLIPVPVPFKVPVHTGTSTLPGTPMGLANLIFLVRMLI
jgi:hypothetical protein